MNNYKIARFFEAARDASKFSDFKQTQVGSVITYQNKILCVGWNMKKVLPLQKKFNKLRCKFDPENAINSAHAEISAISNLLKTYNLNKIDVSKCNIFIFRAHKDGTLALARPCPACMGAIKKIGIERIFYTSHNHFIHENIKNGEKEEWN